jgi:hypothetical protein
MHTIMLKVTRPIRAFSGIAKKKIQIKAEPGELKLQQPIKVRISICRKPDSQGKNIIVFARVLRGKLRG